MATAFGSPDSIPAGPIFVDNAACRCSLQQPVVDASSNDTGASTGQQVVWRCVGNETAPLKTGTDGKFFFPMESDVSNQPLLSLPPQWDQDPPATQNPQTFSNGALTPLHSSNSSQLSLQDSACTGQKDAKLSQKLYGFMQGKGPGLCALSPQVVPMPLQNATSWNQTGCLQGFYCPNNTVNAPPVYCPPEPDCLGARLATGFCLPGQGTFEPAICPAGKFCPPGGKTISPCPAGNYCPVGSSAPIPCSIGAWCPEGTVRNMSFLPLVCLVVLDLVLVTWHLAVTCSKKAGLRKRSARRVRHTVRSVAYLVDRDSASDRKPSSPDPEIFFDSRIRSPCRRDTRGFLSALADAQSFGEENTPQKADADMMQFVQLISKCISGTRFGLSFEFENLRYQSRSNGKIILSDVTGRIDSGSLWAVMGASGAGKTTFVNVLMGKTKHTSGTTKINGARGKMSDYRRIIGYVPQDDILLPELTVYENILHSARIRLPSSWNDREIRDYVDVLIRCLQLEDVKTSLVGSPTAPVISGGQRKRVSIGLELAAAPMALFLDEPTSGLDAAAAASIMGILKALTKVGMTVVAIIHQPRQVIFESLDNLLLFGAGRMLYQGQAHQVTHHFESVGFEFPKHANPADVLMDIIAGQGQLYKKSGDIRVESLINYWAQQSPSRSASLAVVASAREHVALRKSIHARGAYFHRQLWFCLQRAFLQQLRSHNSFYYELGVGAIAGFLVGLSEYNAKGQNFVGLFNAPYTYLSSAMNYSSILQFALLIALSIGLTASSPGVKVFGEEKLVYYREAASGHNRFAYYLGKVIATLPRMVIANLHFTILVLLLSTPLISFPVALAVNFLYFYCIYGLASIVSMIVRREDGPLIATLSSLIVGVLSGVSPSLSAVSGWHMEWLWRLSPGTWLGEAYWTENVAPLSYLFQTELASQETGYTVNQLSMDLLMLFVVGTVYRVIAFVAMCLFNRHRQR